MKLWIISPSAIPEGAKLVYTVWISRDDFLFRIGTMDVTTLDYIRKALSIAVSGGEEVRIMDVPDSTFIKIMDACGFEVK